ncbi:MAG: hypothetical protein KGJ78_06765 [Alphaproteobacteria bacterium]|nr:hypothetical protein [Alphaproteobacteria bacterium]
MQSGTTMDCTGDQAGALLDYNTNAGINTLNVNSLTGLGGPDLIRLAGTGSASGNGSNAIYTCTGLCTITINADQSWSCVPQYDSHSNPLGVCNAGTASAGPSGNSGPQVLVNVNAPTSAPITIGLNQTAVAVVGWSQGSNGGNGGNAYVFGSAGDGGNGADGGTVAVNFTGVIPSGSHGGILALSQGGNGGNGGSAYVIGGSAGSGGLGGYGGQATANFNGGSITTTGKGNVGVLAISQGGNGGNAGGGGGLVYVGGGGNAAGQAGQAEVYTAVGTTITTYGDFAHGVAVMSLGGGGGSGSGGFGLLYSGGGSGSTGGNGGAAIVDANGSITTSGEHAHGILAQSIGGGGGSADTTAGAIALGGSGGPGGSGGAVTVRNTGTIITNGFGSNSIEAQSIGGGGGNGANSGGLFSMGGDGSGTTIGGTVSVTNSGVLETYSSSASGILAQSIGGGGGNGGTSGGLFSFGGSGGSGADGGTVTVTNSGDILTGIDAGTAASPGILAQSIGGGGGNGGGSVSAGAGLAVAFGGQGGMAGSGSSVYVMLDNANAAQATGYDITTFGDTSSAIVAQSIGGGGGNGGFAVAASASPTFSVALGVGGNGGAGGGAGIVEVDTKGALTTYGLSSNGILAQSIGGGGGNGGFSVAASVSTGASLSLGLGGSGAAGGGASDVAVSSFSDITTLGDNSYGILAQSIGGGGGNGGFSVAASGGTLGVSVGVGGSGGAGGNAANVGVASLGNFVTTGDNATVIAAQSIGGGGGNGGFSVAGSIGAGGASVSVGGSGADGGYSGIASLDSSGYVVTAGDNSIGLLAQSLGGGGGNGGFSASASISVMGSAAVGVGGSGGGGQHANSASVYADGAGYDISVGGYGGGWTLVTEGANATGIEAQSIGGGGGNGGFAGTLALSGGSTVGLSLGGSGGDGSYAAEALVQSGFGRANADNIFTFGDNSAGIVAQSIGGGGGNGGFAVSLSGSFNGGSSAAVTLGGKGGNGGTAALAEVDSIGKITTLGNLSDGIIVQSIGGGGGSGGFSVALSAATSGYAGAVAVGGSGGAGNDAGAAVLNSVGEITTYGQQSTGLFAQSVGGGGGNGGFAGAGSLTLGAVGAAVGLGGSGAGGGNASTVDLTNSGDVATYGNQSSAIIAQSIGGGGGNGGSTIGLAVGGLGSASVAIGGSAGAGGSADDVVVTSTGNLTTGIGYAGGATSNDAFGILAQSLGGGGGNGGFAGSLSAAGAIGVSVSVGGMGGAGGSAGTVDVTSIGNIATAFDNSGGILAQSVGGGGGNGGFSVALAASAQIEDVGGAAAVSVGGFGGVANASSDVTVTSTGTILTQGFDSSAISAQSIGGGGGNGGFSVAGAASLGQAGIGISVGGFGAGGGDSAAATVNSYGAGYEVIPTADSVTIETDGMQSNGILAQSLGGGGGNGGFSVAGAFAADGGAVALSVGGFGAGGGSSSTVDVTSYNNILTRGFASNAISAQSIGGGGGNGGFAASVSAGSEFAGSVAVGGFALSGGGNAGMVTANSFGILETQGTGANGILAQSIGGGGGNGGFALSGAFTLGSAGVSASLGGFGSNGGAGADVIVNSNVGTSLVDNVATIQTSGESANGIEAQSIGGGGGNGGFSGGFTATAGAVASMTFSVGGFGGAGNSAGSVAVTSVDNVLTAADGSNGILAQSIGGGGGNGGFSFAGTLSVPDGNSLSLSASLGGFGGSGGNAGFVSVDSTGLITTTGLEGNGVVAQSLGGGGGNGGVSVASTFNFASGNNVPSITASVGGFGGSGGAGGDVDVTRNGAIMTTGEQAVGIIAQSIGGGGGNGGVSIAGSIGGPDAKQITASVGGFGGAGSEAGNVMVRNTGAITTGAIVMEEIQIAQPGRVFITVPVEYGYASHGILAQSIGGGGGNGGFAFSGSIGPTGEGTSLNLGVTVGGFGGGGGLAGDVDVGNDGLITTYGANADGIAAQSIGGGGGNGGGALTGQIAAGDPQSGGRSINIGVTVGGFGGDGNLGGNVVIEQSGGIRTYGAGSNGILAQSIGGGGGNGGGANTLSLQLATSCTFTIPGAPQIGNCQSPKSSSANVQVDVGGFGGTGNNAGTVEVTNHSFIITSGSTASGIMAQSIGGGGGNGGQAIMGLSGMFQGADYVDIGTTLATLPIGLTGITTGFGKITVGGFGGAAGDGSTVTVTNEGVISTSGDTSYGIEAQSVGGGGGNGGNASSGVTGLASVGGFGAASGAGGDITVTNSLGANIVTTGLASDAIFAQSIGGGGGNGGAAGALLALGGFGGASGNGGAVDVENNASLQTSGDTAIGILAQSIGGGGGNGGGTGLSGIAVGGFAGVLGSIGNGGDVTVDNAATATILTLGFGSHGIEAQSVGGGGGNGGGSTLVAAVTVGGHGGSSGDGGHVQIFNHGLVETDGDDSYGLFGQSVGGSGGNGGGSIVSAVTVGGYGGSSGNGGEVDIANTNTILTLGQGSDAINALSIGGGGGNAGGHGESLLDGGLGLGLLVSVGSNGGGGGNGGIVDVVNSGLLETVGDTAAAIRALSIGGGGGNGGRAIGTIAVGGNGGAAGDGGDVTVTNNAGGVIWTQGILADGIFAQSVGGGGGIGGGAWSADVIGFSVSVGGSGVGGGAGGAVLVDNYAQVRTGGLGSDAIFAQSIGGGGGDGAVAGSFSTQILGITPSVAVAIGGNGGVGGNGGSVTVNNRATGSIVSNGAYSTSVFAQSVGGGGGVGGYAMAVASPLSGTVTIALGGSSAAGGDGGDVAVTNDGQIVINGKDSVGIMAQSLGGGGGVASAALGVGSETVEIGGQTGAIGMGGNVTVANSGSITINGNNSIGIFAQSVGGGGGMVMPGGGVTAVLTQSGGTGDGGAVTIDNTAGSIVINGANSIAMYLQSVGGGGGAVGLNADPPGQIGAFLFSNTAGGTGAALSTTVNQTGNLIATGANSIALVGQSSALGGNGDIVLNIQNPTGGRSLILGGRGTVDPKSGVGVEILDGADNVLNNAGVISSLPTITGTVVAVSDNDGTFTVSSAGGSLSTVSGIGGYAVIATDANTTINNTGLLVGSVDLGLAGVNAINNEQNAVFDAGAVVIVGAGNMVANAGLLSPGAYNNVSTTAITGNLEQTSTGTYGLDVNLQGPSSDQVNISGTAAMSGFVLANLVNPLTAPGYAVPGTHNLVILDAAGGEAHSNLTLQAFQTAVARYSLAYPNATDIDLAYVIDYSPSGLTPNEHSVGDTVNLIQTAQGSPAFRPIATNLFYLPDVATLAAAYDSLSGEGISAVQQVAFDADGQFLTAVGNQTQEWMSAPPRSMDHAWRLWMSLYGGGATYQGDSAIGSAKVADSSYGGAFGADYQIDVSAVIGAVIGGSVSSFNVRERSTRGIVDAFHVGAYGAWRSDEFYASGIVLYDVFNNSEKRLGRIPSVVLPAALFIDGPYTVPGFTENLEGHFGSSSFSGRFETGYRNDLGPLRATPFIGMDFGALSVNGFTESNAGLPSVIGLSFADRNVTSLPGYLGMMFDARTELGADDVLGSWVKAAWKHEFESTERAVESSFISAPGFAFTAQGARPPRDAAALDAGVRLMLSGNLSISAGFTGQFGAGSSNYAGTGVIKFEW